MKYQHFDTKNLIPYYSRTFKLPNHLHQHKINKYNFTAMAKFRRNKFSYLNTPRHAQIWLFLGIFLIFSVVEVHFLRTLNPKSAFLFFICGMKYPIWLIYATSLHKTGCFFSVALVCRSQPHIWFCNLRLLLAPDYEFQDDINMMVIMTIWWWWWLWWLWQSRGFPRRQPKFCPLVKVQGWGSLEIDSQPPQRWGSCLKLCPGSDFR